MAVVTKIVAEGQLPSSEGSLYIPGAGEYSYGSRLWVFNTNTTAETVDIYVRKTGVGTSRQIRRAVLEANASYELEIDLGPGDDIRAKTTTATEVDYVLTHRLVT